MVDIVMGSPHVGAVSLADLRPGQIGQVVANGGLEGNGKFVIGINREEVNRYVNARTDKDALAVVLETGVLLYNESTQVWPYGEHVHLKLDQYQYQHLYPKPEIET